MPLNDTSVSSTSSMAFKATKNPVMLLKEKGDEKNIPTKYEELELESGGPHNPKFSFRVFFGELVATGSAESNKKAAKHAAAQAILDMLNDQTSSVQLFGDQGASNQGSSGQGSSCQGSSVRGSSVQGPSGQGSSVQGSSVEESSGQTSMAVNNRHTTPPMAAVKDLGNPIEELIETCKKRCLLLPSYTVVGFKEGSFDILCSIGANLKETGSATDQKLAQQEAAFKMLQTLKTMPVERASMIVQPSQGVTNQQSSTAHTDKIHGK